MSGPVDHAVRTVALVVGPEKAPSWAIAESVALAEAHNARILLLALNGSRAASSISTLAYSVSGVWTEPVQCEADALVLVSKTLAVMPLGIPVDVCVSFQGLAAAMRGHVVPAQGVTFVVGTRVPSWALRSRWVLRQIERTAAAQSARASLPHTVNHGEGVCWMQQREPGGQACAADT